MVDSDYGRNSWCVTPNLRIATRMKCGTVTNTIASVLGPKMHQDARLGSPREDGSLINAYARIEHREFYRTLANLQRATTYSPGLSSPNPF